VLIIALERFATPTQSSVINIQATFSHVISKGILKPVKGAQALEEDVKHFCGLIRNRQMKQLSFDVSKGQIRVSDVRNKESKFRVNMDSVPLKALLLQTEGLTTEHRLELSYHLAEAVWRFYPSSWMKREWTNDSVHFMYEKGRNGRKAPGIFVDKPFLHADFSVQPNNVNRDKYRSHEFPTILALGILLLEIELKIDIQEHWEEEDLDVDGKPTVDTNYNTAMRLYEDVSQWPGTSRFDAEKKRIIGICLRPDDFVAPLEIQDSFAKIEYQRSQLWTCTVEPLRRLHEGSLGSNAELDALSLAQSIKAPPRAKTQDEEDKGVSIATLFDDNDMTPTDGDKRNGIRYFDMIRKFKENVILPLPSTGNHAGPGPWQRPVRVAILDSGISGLKDSFIKRHLILRDAEKRIIQTISWFGNDSVDRHGHGTQVARFFLEVAPLAHLYIGKICDGKDIPVGDYDKIAKAIDHAVTKWDVDIISLSFGMDTEDENIKQAILRAVRPPQINTRARIVFAAASNGGPIERRAFPASMSDVICVSASDGHGANARLLSPDPDDHDDDNFITLGAYVRYPPLVVSKAQATQQHTYKSGTSFATPIAAGLAANVLEFARHAGLQGVREPEQAWLYSRRGIAAVLRRLSGENKIDGYRFLRPWLVPQRHLRMTWSDYLKMQLQDAVDHDYSR
jgi:hypothetical protein